MRSLIIDEAGTVLDGCSPALRARLNAWQLGGHFTDYAVRNLGFIVVASRAGSMHVRLRPRLVARACASALAELIRLEGPARVLISHLGVGWQHEMVGGGARAVQRLRVLIGRSDVDRSDDFLRRELSPGDLARENPLQALFRIRAELGAELAAQSHPRGRFAVVTECDSSAELLVSGTGAGLAGELDGYWQNSGASRLAEQPDAAFGRWIIEAYRNVLASGEPALDEIDAVIDWPRIGRMRHRYWRLLLPVPAGERGRVVLCASVKDNDIDLRGASA